VASRAHTAVDSARVLTDFMDPPNVAWGRYRHHPGLT
jgi:hypothetical protein